MDDLQITERAGAGTASAGREREEEEQTGAFKSQWVKLPVKWVEALGRSTSASTYRLALIILIEAFKREQIGGGDCVVAGGHGDVSEYKS